MDPWLTGPHLPGAQTTIDGFDAAVAGDQLTYKAMGYEAFTVHAPTVEVGIGSVDTSDDVVELTQQVTAGVGGGFEA